MRLASVQVLLDDCPEASLYIFDFCHTLYRSNTTNDFLAYLARRGGAAYTARMYAYWVVAKALKDGSVISPRQYMRLRLRALRGLSEQLLVQQGQAFVETRLAEREIAPSMALLDRLVSAGAPVVLLSNTLDVILSPFARKRGVPHFASTLGFDRQGKCAGRYDRQVAAVGKLSLLRAHYTDERIRGALFVTDDAAADGDLLSVVRYPCILERA